MHVRVSLGSWSWMPNVRHLDVNYPIKGPREHRELSDPSEVGNFVWGHIVGGGEGTHRGSGKGDTSCNDRF